MSYNLERWKYDTESSVLNCLQAEQIYVHTRSITHIDRKQISWMKLILFLGLECLRVNYHISINRGPSPTVQHYGI